MTQNIFVERFEQQRNKLGLSQSKMAEALGMSLSTYKRLINGEPSTRTFDIPIKFYHLTGTSIFGPDTHIERQHIILSKMQGMHIDDLILLETIIDYINSKNSK